MIYWLLLIILFICVNLNLGFNNPTLLVKTDTDTTFTRRCLAIIIGILILLVGIRGFTVGYDTGTYKVVYEQYSALNQDTGFELFFDILFKLCYALHLPFIVLSIIAAVISLIPVYFCIRDYSINTMLSLLLFFALGVFAAAFSAMRQILSTVLLMASVRYIFKEDLLKYTLCVVGATLCHNLAIVFFPIYFLRKVKIDFKLLFFVIIGIIALVFIAPMVAKFVSQFTAIDYYSRYYKTGVLLNDLSLFNLLYTLGMVGVFTVCYGLQKKVKEKIPEHEKEYKIFLLIFMFAVIARVFAMFSGMPELMNRFTAYFFFGIIFLIPLIIKLFPKKNIPVITNLVMLASFVFFYFLIMVKGSNGIAKYYTVLGDNVIVTVLLIVLIVALGCVCIVNLAENNRLLKENEKMFKEKK